MYNVFNIVRHKIIYPDVEILYIEALVEIIHIFRNVENLTLFFISRFHYFDCCGLHVSYDGAGCRRLDNFIPE